MEFERRLQEEDHDRDPASQNKSKVVGKEWWPMEVNVSGRTTAQRNTVRGGRTHQFGSHNWLMLSTSIKKHLLPMPDDFSETGYFRIHILFQTILIQNSAFLTFSSEK